MFLEGLRKTTNNLDIDGVPTEIRTEDFPNKPTRMVSEFAESGAWANQVPKKESIYIVAPPFSLLSFSSDTRNTSPIVPLVFSFTHNPASRNARSSGKN
jgi:hypothetical protein